MRVRTMKGVSNKIGCDVVRRSLLTNHYSRCILEEGDNAMSLDDMLRTANDNKLSFDDLDEDQDEDSDDEAMPGLTEDKDEEKK